MSGLFIVLEGIDGCGKTTQLKHLADWLPTSGLMQRGKKVHVTREPGGTELGLALRKLLLNPPGGSDPEPISELLLYAADRAQHVCSLIRPALEQGDWVLSDRFSGSTIAYQGYGRLLDLNIIKQLETIATDGLRPHLTLLMDLPVQESLTRRITKTEDRIEAEGSDFLSRVATGFNHLAVERNWAVVAANKSKQEVSLTLETEIKKRFQLFYGVDT